MYVTPHSANTVLLRCKATGIAMAIVWLNDGREQWFGFAERHEQRIKDKR